MATVSGFFLTTVLFSLIDSRSTSTTFSSETAIISTLFPKTIPPSAIPTLATGKVESFSAYQQPRKGEDLMDNGARTRMPFTLTKPFISLETSTASTTSTVTNLPPFQSLSPSPSASTFSGSRGLSRSTILGLGVGVPLGVLALFGVLVLVFHYGKRTGLRSTPARRMISLRTISGGSWFRKSGSRKAELCAESQQIVDIGSFSQENEVKELEAENVVVELEGDGVENMEVGGNELMES